MKPCSHNYGFSLAMLLFVSVYSFAQNTATETPNKNLVLPTNTIAVLPLTYIGHGSDVRSKEMPVLLQEIVITYMGSRVEGWLLQDPSQTNASLYKHGITPVNIRQYSPKELAEIVHAQYLVTGSVMQEAGTILTVTHKRSSNRREEREGSHNQSQNRRHSHVSSATVQSFHTDVSVIIYNDHGERIFSQSRRSILSDVDAYKSTLRYLLKRTPMYSK